MISLLFGLLDICYLLIVICCWLSGGGEVCGGCEWEKVLRVVVGCCLMPGNGRFGRDFGGEWRVSDGERAKRND
jgi:hypothetical protein